MTKQIVALFSWALVLVALVGLVGGCSTAGTVAQDVGIVAKKVCNFDVSTCTEAQMARQFIGANAPLVGAIVGVPISAAAAQMVFDTVATSAQTGACVLLTDLQNAIAFFDQLSTQTKLMKLPSPVPDILHLRIRANG